MADKITFESEISASHTEAGINDDQRTDLSKDRLVELRSMCEERLSSVYGEDIPEECLARLDAELETVDKNNVAALIIAYANAFKKAEPNKHTLCGLAYSSSYIMYLLGLNLLDPLDRELMDGHICDVMYAKRGLDGNLWFKTAFDMQGRFLAYLENEPYINKVCLDYSQTWPYEYAPNSGIGYKIIPEEDFIAKSGAKSFSHYPDTTFLRDKQIEFIECLAHITETNPLNVPYSDKAVIDFITGNSDNGTGNKGIYLINDDMVIKDIIAVVKPKTFYQLSKTIGLYFGKGTWSVDIKRDFLNCKININDILATRDDVFELFVKEYGNAEEAIRASEIVRKGRKLTDERYKQYKKYSNHKELESIGYMNMRSITLYAAMLVCTQAYYKMNYPEEFYYSYFHYLSPMDEFAHHSEQKTIEAASWENYRQVFVPYLETAMEMYQNGYDWRSIFVKFHNKEMSLF